MGKIGSLENTPAAYSASELHELTGAVTGCHFLSGAATSPDSYWTFQLPKATGYLERFFLSQ